MAETTVNRFLVLTAVALIVILHYWFGDKAAPFIWPVTLNLLVFGLLALVRRSPYSWWLQSLYREKIREAASQEERNRLARDLHDSIKQQIFAIQTSAAAAQARFGSDEAGAREALEAIRTSAREAMTEMEAMLDQLRANPLEAIGLAEALRRQCEALGFRTGARVAIDVSDLPSSDQLRPGAAQALYRIAQEALSNVARHARATEVRLSVATEGGRCSLSIQDNGMGFASDIVSEGMGLSNMRRRAADQRGTLTIDGAPGRGTRIAVSIPLVSATIKVPDKVLVFAGMGICAGLVSPLINSDFARGFARGLGGTLFVGALLMWFQARHEQND